jgi:hypothetical protein
MSLFSPRQLLNSAHAVLLGLITVALPQMATAEDSPTPANALRPDGLHALTTLSHSNTIKRPFENLAATLGWGYDSRTGEFKQPCVAFDKIKDIHTAPFSAPNGPGEFTSQFFESVDSYEAIGSKLGLDFAAEMHYFAGEGSVRLTMMSDVQLTRYSSTGLLHMYLEKSTSLLTHERPYSEEIKRLARKSPGAFRARCGDSFIYAETDGGELVAMLSASGSTRAEQHSIQAAFNASFNAVTTSGKVSALFSDLTTVFASTSQKSIRAWTSGGKGVAIKLDDLQKQSDAFFESADARPVAVALKTIGYEQVDGLIDSSFQMSPTTIGYCALSLDKYINDLQFMHEHQDQFIHIKEADVRSESDRATSALAYVQKLIKANTSRWQHTCPSLPTLPDRTDQRYINIGACGWNTVGLARPYDPRTGFDPKSFQVQPAFLESNSAGWSLTQMGRWCAWDYYNATYSLKCDQTWFEPGHNSVVRCNEGDRRLNVEEGKIVGPCSLESVVGDNQCSDNTNPPGDANSFRVVFTANLPIVNWDKFKADLGVKMSAGDLR